MKKVYLAIKYYSDHKNRPIIEAISCAVAKNGMEVICIARAILRYDELADLPELLSCEL